MPTQTRNVAPGPRPRTVVTQNGELLTAPTDWALLPPGDAGLTRRVKAAGPTWTVQEKQGRRLFSRGVYAPAARIEHERARLQIEREGEGYQRKLQAGQRRRQAQQADYVEDFRGAVLRYLAFHPRYAPLGEQVASAVTTHATPVGSGTVARTQRIPIEQRAEAAVIAWMRHQTTGYDDMAIARIKGERRKVRRLLAERSKWLLGVYRRGEPCATCPLTAALSRPHTR